GLPVECCAITAAPCLDGTPRTRPSRKRRRASSSANQWASGPRRSMAFWRFSLRRHAVSKRVMTLRKPMVSSSDGDFRKMSGARVAAEALGLALLAAIDKPPEVVLNETLDERPAERRRRWNAELLARHDALEQIHGCHSAAQVARGCTKDPLER